MKYLFLCPQCGRQTTVEMPAADYHADGHRCDCGAELIRDPKGFCRNYQVNCDGFYSEHQAR